MAYYRVALRVNVVVGDTDQGEREKKNLFFCVTFYYCVCESPIVVQVVKSLILFYFFCKESIVKESAAEQSHETKGKRTLALVLDI